MRPSTALLAASLTLALAACNRPDANRTTSVPPGVKNATAITEPIVTPSAPPAPSERGPLAANANTMAPGTDASAALASDEAKKAANGADPSATGAQATARDTPANDPRHGTLTQDQESNQMPKAGQANNHSSPALEQNTQGSGK